VPLVEQELPTLPEHLSSALVFSGLLLLDIKFSVKCFVDRCFCCWPLCCLFFFDIRFWLPPFGILDTRIMITSLWYLRYTRILITSLWYLRYTDSDYPFGIFKLLLKTKYSRISFFLILQFYLIFFYIIRTENWYLR
jgi:hypothetical protein